VSFGFAAITYGISVSDSIGYAFPRLDADVARRAGSMRAEIVRLIVRRVGGVLV